MTVVVDQVVLRPLRWWDIEPVYRLELELFPEDPWSLGMFWSELAGEGRHYFVAWAGEAGSEIAGYAGLHVTDDEAEVQTIAVATAHQRRGVGTALFERLLEIAGHRDVLLEVRVDNTPAQSLYRRYGFERVGMRRGYYQNGADALIMRKAGSRV